MKNELKSEMEMRNTKSVTRCTNSCCISPNLLALFDNFLDALRGALLEFLSAVASQMTKRTQSHRTLAKTVQQSKTNPRTASKKSSATIAARPVLSCQVCGKISG